MSKSNLPSEWIVPDYLPFEPRPATDPVRERGWLRAIVDLDAGLSPAERNALVVTAATSMSFLCGAITAGRNRPQPFISEAARLSCRSTLGAETFFDAECL